MDENFDTRRRIYNLAPWQIAQVETARRCGASAKFAGSGGAIVGTYRDAAMLEDLKRELGAIGSRAFVPEIRGQGTTSENPSAAFPSGKPK
jgi:glucuronokinase